ncbi:hypothetical protein PUNSTDRAFT_66729 [Punctularia strigosozonata HHB-11173 SS5]|uniref:uncharacterized protein n=1 Tax=Punctularia strigosozonata (strain HHB-11173) TaxID=741275 RepID=UPI0004417F0A|nr:uncharacterized protein PUNSTDRAFT_66729 [Punctularia strigosozonata HHB-11173 SS5]EIN09426.1 hypothetical protein PUNSTDRAFT_66729 [Punctularia strigosozonata HHB-11173 SS5]
MQKRLAEIKDRVEEWPIALKNLVYWSYVQVAQPWLDANEGRRTCWKICMVNTAIWMAWQVPRLQPLMQRHFTHNPLSGLSYTILTSMFSHRSLLHLIANCMALSSFGSAAGIYLARQQHTKGCERESTIRYHLEAFILSAGLFSGLISHVASSKILYPMMVRRLTSSTAAGNVANATRDTTEQVSRKNAILPSLGISGAVYGAVTLTALAFPDTEISLMIPPTYPIPIQYGVGALVMLDIIGVLRGWRFLDHYAHLGGAAFGVLYYHYGPRTWNTLRCAAEDEGKAHKPWRVDPGRT